MRKTQEIPGPLETLAVEGAVQEMRRRGVLWPQVRVFGRDGQALPTLVVEMSRGGAVSEAGPPGDCTCV